MKRLFFIVPAIVFLIVFQGSLAVSSRSPAFGGISMQNAPKQNLLARNIFNIALNRPVFASSFSDSCPPVNAIDGSTTTVWNSGSAAPAWFRVDFGSESTVNKVRLMTEQSAPGTTVHEVYFGNETEVYTLVHTFSGTTSPLEWLEYIPGTAPINVRFLKIITVSSLDWVAWREIEAWGDTKEPKQLHIKHFGYYCSAWDIPEFKSNMSDFSDHCDFVDVMNSEAQMIQEAALLGMQSVLCPYWHFWNGTGLRTDYLASWNSYADTVQPYANSILGIYPIDEPYWGKGTKEECELVNAAIKARFPDKPIMVTFAYTTVNDSLVIPAGYDWISFDEYGTFSTIPGYLKIIKSKMSPGQKIFLTCDGYKAGNVTPTAREQQDWVIRARQYYNLARLDTDVVALMPFLWPSTSAMTGVNNMTVLRDEFRRIGKEILSNNSAFNLPPETPAAPSGPASGLVGSSYSYSTSATDQNGNWIKYGWDWDGDGIVDEWSSSLGSGALDSRNHAWASVGDCYMKVKAQDEHGCESAWSPTLQVTITGSSAVEPMFLLFLSSLIAVALPVVINRCRKKRD